MLNGINMASKLTRISDADSDVTSLKLGAVESQSLFQSVESCKFCITKTLWLHLHFVLDNSDICTLAASKEVRYISNGSIKREVAEMNGKGGFVGQWKFLANRVTYNISIRNAIG